jgi:F-type H+-transporting ATPase subunit delta
VANERPSQAYAQAVYDKAVEDWLTPLKTIAASLAQSNLIRKLDDAGLAFSKKQELLRPLFPKDAPAEVQNFVYLLATKNDMHLLPEIVSNVDRFAHRGMGVTVAKVTSAIALTDSEKRALETKLRKQFGDNLDFDYVVDKEILGGVIVRVGDKVIDGSVAGKLAALKEKLK